MNNLDDVKAKFEGVTREGTAVKLLAYFPEQEYPIIAAIQLAQGEWSPRTYTLEGDILKGVKSPSDLVLKQKVLPKDVLCEVWNGKNTRKRYSNGNGAFFDAGQDSRTTSGTHSEWEHYRVIGNPPRPWSGGSESPIPEGCTFEVCIGQRWIPSGHVLALTWDFEKRPITAFRITGQK